MSHPTRAQFRKAFGQHFLKDRELCSRIAAHAKQLISEHAARTVLEIGPGKGALTEPLAHVLGDLPAVQFRIVERDWMLVPDINERFPSAKVETADFLDLDPAVALGAGPTIVVSNLPYSSGTAILLKLHESRAQIPAMILMFQLEVAERLRANPDTKSWGSLSLAIQNHWDVTSFAHVAPTAFVPPPKVHSEVVVLSRRAHPRIEVAPEHTKRFEGFIRAAFQHRRKMLRSGLPRTAEYQNALVEAQVDGTKRAESLSWEDWTRLYQAYCRPSKAE